jgi:hypothetical protein
MSPRRSLAAIVFVLSLVAAACAGDATVSADGSDTTAGSDTTGDSSAAVTNESATFPRNAAPDCNGDGTQVDLPDGTSSVSALRSLRGCTWPNALVDPAEVFSGGVAPDQITPVDDPQFDVASEVDFLADDEPVISLEFDGEARAYPVQILTWNEIANDTVAGEPITVTYCPLCNSAVAYKRTVDGAVLDFGTSGMLFNSSLVMYDRQTESLWTHFEGQAVVGDYTGVQLELVPVQTVRWASFRDAHPDALVLNLDTGVSRDYGRNPYPGYDGDNPQPDLFFGDIDTRYSRQTRVLGVREVTTGESVAVILDELAVDRVRQFDFNGQPVVAWSDDGLASALDTRDIAEGREISQTGVFVAEADGVQLTFSPTDDGFTDNETNSEWNVLGQAVSGELAGTQLQPLEHLDTFWFAWTAFNPDTDVL